MSELASDIQRNIAAKLNALVEREIQLANAMLGGIDTSLILYSLAVGMLGTAAATIAAQAKPEVDAGEVFDTIIDTTVQQVRERRAELLVRIAAANAQNLEAAR